MTGFPQRAVALAAAALLAGAVAVAISQAGRDSTASPLEEPAAGSWGGWTPALAGVAPLPPGPGRASGCDWLVRRRTQGVIHPTLPCGAWIVVEYAGRRALTRVVAHVPVAAGRQLDLTPVLARRLGLEGVREVRWAFTR